MFAESVVRISMEERVMVKVSSVISQYVKFDICTIGHDVLIHWSDQWRYFRFEPSGAFKWTHHNLCLRSDCDPYLL